MPTQLLHGKTLNYTTGKKLAIGFSALALVASTQSTASATTTSQWATSATATTEYSTYQFAATEATGAPNAGGCDRSGTWASVNRFGIDSITLSYATAVIPTSLKVYQNNIEGAVSKIEVSANGTTWTSVYTGDPTKAVHGTCVEANNYDDILTVSVKKVRVAVNHVRITVNQTTNGWAEIDAVALIGKKSQTIGAVPSTLKLKKTMKLPVKTNKQLKVTWTSSTPSVCTVSAGTLKAVAKGTCKITGTSAEDATYGVVAVTKSVKINE